MAEKAVIELVADPSGLKPGYDALKALGQLDVQQQEAFVKANAEFQASQQKTTVAVQNTAKAIQQIPKDIAGAAIKQTTEQVQKLATAVAVTTTQHVSLRTEIAKNRDELAKLAEQGKRNTKEYQELADKTGELKLRFNEIQKEVGNLGNENQTLAGITSAIRGMAGAFAVAQASSALFGDESKDLQKDLLKVTATMELLTGVSEVQEALRKSSSATLLVESLQRRAAAASINLESSAESKNIIVKYAAIAAQKLLNLVEAASPAGLLVAVMTVLAATYLIVADATHGAAERQIELNGQQQKQIELSIAANEQNKEEVKTINALNAARIKQLELENQGLEAVRKQEQDNFAARSRINQENVNQVKARVGQILDDAQKEKAIETDLATYKMRLENEKIKLQEQINEQEVTFYNNAVSIIRGRYKLTDKLNESEKEAAEGKKKNIESLLQLVDDAQKETIALGEEGIVKDKQRNLEAIQNAKARFELIALNQLEANKKLSNIRLQAERGVLVESEKLELESTQHSQDEIALIRAQYTEQRKQLNAKYAIERLNDQRKAVDAELQIATQGSQRQLALKLLDLSIAEKAELAVLHLTVNERFDIEAKYQKQRLDLQIDYNLQAQLRQLSSDKVMVEARIKTEEDGYRQILADRLKMIDIEASEASAKNQAQFDKRLINAKQYQDEETRIEYKGINDRLAAEREANDKRIELDATATQAEVAHQKAVLELRKNGLFTSIFAKQKATQEEFDLEDASLNAQKKTNDEFYKDKDNLADEYSQKQQALDDQIAANKQAKDQQAFEFGADLANKAFEQVAKFAEKAVQVWQESNDAYYAQRIATLEKSMNAELSLENTSNVQKAAIRNKYLKEEREIKLKQWKVDQEAKEVQAVINTALGITSALATSGNIYAGIALAALVAATGAIEIGIISSAKPPAFAEGVVNFKGKGTGTSDSNMALISHGESVVTASATQKYAPYLEAMNAGMEIPQFAAPTVSSEIMQTFITQVPEFDYNKFGEVVAEKLAKNPSLHLELNQNGYTAYLQKGIHRTQLLNNRIATK